MWSKFTGQIAFAAAFLWATIASACEALFPSPLCGLHRGHGGSQQSHSRRVSRMRGAINAPAMMMPIACSMAFTPSYPALLARTLPAA